MNITKETVITLASEQGIVIDPSLLIDYPIGTWFYTIHHEIVVEKLEEPLLNRIHYILTGMETEQRQIRFDSIRVVKDQDRIDLTQKIYNETIAPARKIYDETIASARKIYDESTALAWEIYEIFTAPEWKIRDKTTASAWKIYDETIASACKICNETIASACKIYDETIASAQKIYNESIMKQWNEEYPDHPKWNENGLVFPD
jgi:hypothetical protein